MGIYAYLEWLGVSGPELHLPLTWNYDRIDQNVELEMELLMVEMELEEWQA